MLVQLSSLHPLSSFILLSFAFIMSISLPSILSHSSPHPFQLSLLLTSISTSLSHLFPPFSHHLSVLTPLSSPHLFPFSLHPHSIHLSSPFLSFSPHLHLLPFLSLSLSPDHITSQSPSPPLSVPSPLPSPSPLYIPLSLSSPLPSPHHAHPLLSMFISSSPFSLSPPPLPSPPSAASPHPLVCGVPPHSPQWCVCVPTPAVKRRRVSMKDKESERTDSTAERETEEESDDGEREKGEEYMKSLFDDFTFEYSLFQNGYEIFEEKVNYQRALLKMLNEVLLPPIIRQEFKMDKTTLNDFLLEIKKNVSDCFIRNKTDESIDLCIYYYYHILSFIFQTNSHT